MIAHTIRAAITDNIVLTSLSESAHYMDGIVYTAMSFLCRKTTSHCRRPTPIGIRTTLLRSFYTTLTANRVCPVPCAKPFLLFFGETKDPCAVFASNVLCHLKQLLLFLGAKPQVYTKRWRAFQPQRRHAIKGTAVGETTKANNCIKPLFIPKGVP